ncbi:hypothetical protein [Nocardia sp. NPDC051832]|uniref:hypothetical protein n=1 Tax=Nocardia sp. NPDC051832 TaxID=3155673 RepID=UPI0034461621
MNQEQITAFHNVEVRIVPLAAGFPLSGGSGPFVIMEFPTDSSTGQSIEPTTVYVEASVPDSISTVRPPLPDS